MNYKPFLILFLINFFGRMVLEVAVFALALMAQDNELLLYVGMVPYAFFAFPQFLWIELGLPSDFTFTMVFRVFNALTWSATMLLLGRGMSWFYRWSKGKIQRKRFPKPNAESASS